MRHQSPVRIVLANRPRLFRELLQHALAHHTAQQVGTFDVVEVTDSVPTAAQLQNVDWLIVDEETAAAAARVATAQPTVKVLALEGRGTRVKVLEDGRSSEWQVLSSAPSLDDLVGILATGLGQRHQEEHA